MPNIQKNQLFFLNLEVSTNRTDGGFIKIVIRNRGNIGTSIEDFELSAYNKFVSFIAFDNQIDEPILLKDSKNNVSHSTLPIDLPNDSSLIIHLDVDLKEPTPQILKIRHTHGTKSFRLNLKHV